MYKNKYNVGLAYWVQSHSRPIELIGLLKKFIEKNPEKKVGLDWTGCSNTDLNYFIVTRDWLKEFMEFLSPIKENIKFINLTSPGLIKLIKELALEIEPLKKHIEEKKKMLKLLKEIAVEDIKEGDEGTEFSFKDEDMTVVVIDHTFEIDSKVIVKIYKEEV